MTPVERLRAAIEKLDGLRTRAFPGPWESYTSRPENGSHSFVMSDQSSILSVSANDGTDEEFRAPTADLVAALYRTRIEALLPGDADHARRMLQRAFEHRTGVTTLPIDLEEDLRSAFIFDDEDVDPVTGEVKPDEETGE